jgi:S-DNA-T family DNA segregation ATPase FtsK/SpoIIIE
MPTTKKKRSSSARSRPKTRAAAARKPARAPARQAARKPAPRRDWRDAIDGLEQRHFDLLGLALIAFAVYAAFVLYAGWDGGKVGGWLQTSLEYAVGRVAYVVPLAVFGLGVALIARPVIAAPRALNWGTALVLLALLLAFSAQTLGLGPDHPVRHGFFNPHFFTEHGGAVGEGMYWAAHTLFQRLGAQILAVLMMISGLLLLTGTTIANLFDKGRSAGRMAADTTRGMTRAVRERDTGFQPWTDPPGEDIQITRAAETEALETMVLPPDPEAAEDAAWDDEPYEDTAIEREADNAFAYEDPDEEPIEAVEPVESEGTTPMGNQRHTGGVTASDEIAYTTPPIKTLERSKGDQGPDPRDLAQTQKNLLEALEHFGVDARLIGTVSGPHVSRYELQLAPGTKVGKVAQLKDDLAYALASTDIRILAPIPGKKAVGVEVPNARRRMVRLGDIYEGRPKGASPLTAWLGKDVSGQAVWTDLALMPHALVAGTTGSGKSGCINAVLTSILLHASPNEVRLVLVDPKQVELNHYESLPHLLTPVVTNPRLAANVLANLIGEMENRYSVMGEARARNLSELNKARRRKGEPPLPHILCVIDELADLMMVAPAEVEDSIIRLAQKSRAVGIHLLLATQRPSTDVITGTIKVNIPSRIAFSVASQIDSRVILDQGGAESLLGQGDMLFRPIGTSKLQRIQGAFVGEDEIARIAKHWARQGEPQFDDALLEEQIQATKEEEGGEFSPDQDDLLEDAARIVVESGTASVSMIQRRLRVGYTRAGRLIDMLERRGYISGYEGSKPRQVLVSMAELHRLQNPTAQAPLEKVRAGGAAEDVEVNQPAATDPSDEV